MKGCTFKPVYYLFFNKAPLVAERAIGNKRKVEPQVNSILVAQVAAGLQHVGLMRLYSKDGGRECPPVIEERTRQVLTLNDQCLSLLGEVAQVMRHHLCPICNVHGCTALPKQQHLLSVSGRVHSDSIAELGLKISRQWAATRARFRSSNIICAFPGPQLCWAWCAKEA